MRGRLGKLQANVATARKIAILFYRMIMYGQDYIDVGEKIYLQKQEERRKKSLIKTAHNLGLKVINNDGEILA